MGSSGHASVLMDAIALVGTYKVVGYLDDTVAVGTVRRGLPVLGCFSEAATICADRAVNKIVIAIGDNWWRRKVYSRLNSEYPGHLSFPIIQHPMAVVSASAKIGQGTVVHAGAHIGPGSRVGEFCIINTLASIDHDCTMNDFSSVAPGVSTGGLVQIGECSAIGVGACISDRISIGHDTVVGAGAVVIRDIPDLVVAYGNPAMVQRARVEGEKYVKSLKDSDPL